MQMQYNVHVKGILHGIQEKNHYIGHALRMQIIFHDMGGISPAKKHDTTYLKRQFGSLRNHDTSAIISFPS